MKRIHDKPHRPQHRNKPKKVGIIGGLGPETSSRFYLNINNKFKQLKQSQPAITLENLPVSFEAERKFITGQITNEHFELLMKAIGRFNNSDIDFIAIPCNTVHTFIDRLRKKSKKPILSIIEESVRECKRRELKKVGLLASTKTAKEKLFEKELRKSGIDIVLPEQDEQDEISRIILRIIHNKSKKNDKDFLLGVINRMKSNGAESVILGCTDIPLLIKENESPLHLINSCKVLEDAVVKLLST